MQLLKLMKKAGLEAMDNSVPTQVFVGTVTSVDPLEITIDQRLPIPAEFLLLTDNVRDYEVEISFDDSGIVHDVNGYLPGTEHEISKLAFTSRIKNKITVYNSLKIGESVKLIREQGGQKFIVLNRVVKA